jgi:molecular chaperone GrpE
MTEEEQKTTTDESAEITVTREAWEKAQAAEATLKETEDQILRLKADFDNFRKRIQKEKEDSVKYAHSSLLEDLLPVIDNFELGLKAVETTTDVKVLLQGLNMVKTQLDRFLDEAGVKAIETEGKIFDPKIHEAVEQQVHEDLEEGLVVGLRRKGYMLKDRLLRPASVVVSHKSAPASN